jgi:alkyl hydroperoxide reductase subunit F
MTMYDLIIVGGGPAGLTATVYAIRKRLETLLITKDLGGKTNWHLELPDVDMHHVITGEEIIGRFRSQIDYLDFARVMDGVQEIAPIEDGPYYQITTKSGRTFETKAVILATGARARRLGVPGEPNFLMRGVCYSAVSYAPLFIDRRAAVVGDGELALRSASELAQIARRVYLVAPSKGQLDSRLGQKLRQQSNVTILEGYTVQEVRGDRYARSIVVQNGDDAHELVVDATFIELDLVPNAEVVKDLVDLDEKGRVVVDSRNHTSRPGLFAAGDVTSVYAEQVLIAAGEGAKAALSAYEYLLNI